MKNVFIFVWILFSILLTPIYGVLHQEWMLTVRCRYLGWRPCSAKWYGLLLYIKKLYGVMTIHLKNEVKKHMDTELLSTSHLLNKSWKFSLK
jgi:hypothetical protein